MLTALDQESFSSEFEPLLSRISFCSDEVDQAIRLAEANLNNFERQFQSKERDAAERHRLGTILHRKEQARAEADRITQMQLERRRSQQASKLEQLCDHNHKIAYWRARTQRHGSTGQWLTRTDQFVQWSVGDNSGVFWCTGKLGSGKTVITGYTVQEMSAKSSPDTEKLAYFFCQHDNEASLQATTILKSIIKQCLDQDEKLYDANTLAIDALLESPNDLDGLEAFLSKLVSGLSRIVIILDGIDECSNKEMKTTLKSLRKLVLQKTSGLKLYLAGDERITDLVASSSNPIHGMNTGCLEARIDLQALVRQLVATKRQDEDLVIGDDHLHQEIVDVLCTASQGMLLWIMFQLEELCSRKTDESIRTALKNLPKDLFETYNRLLARIVEEGSMDVCKKVFRYMAVAKRPLTSEELGEAISIEPCQPYFMRERMINNPTNIIRWCHGLAVLDELNETLQFAHSSVRDFFCSLETEHVVLHGFHFVQEQVEREFGDICVTYLSFNDFKQQLAKSPKQPLLLNPMVMANQALTSDTSSILLQKARELINKRHKSTYINSRMSSSPSKDNKRSPLTAAYRFLQYTTDFWLSHTSGFSPQRGRSWDLFVTLVLETKSVVPRPSILSLLDLDVHGWITDSNDALHIYVFSHQHLGLFRLFMRPNSGDLVVILSEILRWGCFDFLQHLPYRPPGPRPWLEYLATFSAGDLVSALILSGCSWMEDLTMSERSSVFGMVIEEPYHRSEVGRVIFEILALEIDPFFLREYQGERTTVLEGIIRNNWDTSLLREVCSMILATGGDLNRELDDTGKSALHVAAASKKLGAVQVVLRNGATVNAIDMYGQTALHKLVLAPGDRGDVVEIAKQLINNGAFIDAKDFEGKSVLDCAADDLKVTLRRLCN
ncbi:hypothetical protein D6C85_07104 [Aureobasidium pullulans]|uniref:Uncharacterized protein n=1 Tax=Aureobasidium pullulans TaxID=5580 RepID=A0A4S9WSP1_AURPU|nr:hypothetical protein D6C85_07104 [Aureobasidium pullulans]